VIFYSYPARCAANIYIYEIKRLFILGSIIAPVARSVLAKTAHVNECAGCAQIVDLTQTAKRKSSMTFVKASIISSALAATAALAGTASVAHAMPINPQFDTFGVLNDSTGDNVEFGGDGIPNDAVSITRFTDNDNEVTLGLTATPRGSEAPPVGNDGAGTFSATPGEFPDEMTDNNRALWNFSFFIEVADGDGTLADYSFNLLYDFDPGADTPADDHGSFNAGAFVDQDETAPTIAQGSQNLGFDYLTASAFIAQAPTFIGFDPTVNGEYSFALQASDLDGSLLGTSAIRVNVGGGPASVPEPSSFAMLSMALIGLLGFGRAKRRQILGA
jgi:hypothetical protein